MHFDCKYGDYVNGACVCWAGYKLNTLKMCTIATSSPNEGSQLGINMNGVSYWSSAWTFIDLIKQASGWIVQHIDQLDVLYIWNTNERLNLTSTLYPASIPFNRQAVTLMLRDVNNSWPNDIYYVFYDGEGSINFGFDATIIEQGDKYKMKIQVNLTKVRDNGVFMKINRTNPANPLRNIRIVNEKYVNTYQNMPFHPLFVQRLANFKTIRFMNWVQQDGIVDWSDRITPATYTSGQGVAFEYMIHLSNMLKTNAWVIIPYAVNSFNYT